MSPQPPAPPYSLFGAQLVKLACAQKFLVLKGLNRKIKALCGASLWLHYSQSSVVYVAETPD